MTAAWIVIAVAVAIVIIAARKRKGSATPKSVWRITYSPGMPGQPTPRGAGWIFSFPSIPTAHVHYVQNFDPPRLIVGRTLIARFRITGSGFTPQESPHIPATVSLLIQRKGDDWSALGEMQFYRWYSTQTVTLLAGEYELSVPLDVAHWGDVYGGHDAGAFAKALANVENIGLVFGSAGGRGHGVYADPGSTFELITLEVA